MKKYSVLLLIFIVNLIVFLNIKFTAWPEMLAWPYLMLKGWLPYKDIAIAHNPLLLASLTAFYGLFGLGIFQIQVFTWVLIGLVNLITYKIAGKIWGKNIGLLSLLFLLPLLIYYEANGLWFDLALAAFFPLIFFFVLKKRYFCAGICWTLAFLTKQTAIWVLVPITIYTLQGGTLEGVKIKSSIKNVGEFVKGTSIVVVSSLIILSILGVLPEYIYWAYRFAGGILAFAEGQAYFPTFKQSLVGLFPFTVLLGGYLLGKNKDLAGVLIWAFFSMMGIYPRWELFHFLPAVPFLAMGLAMAVYSGRKNAFLEKSVLIFGVFILFLLATKIVSRNWREETRFYENEVKETTSYIKTKVSKDEKIMVLNAWDSFYALTDTLPVARPLVPQLAWYMTMPPVEDEINKDIIADPPRIIIMHPYQATGLDSYQPTQILNFVLKYYYPTVSYGNFVVLEKRS